MDSKRTGRPAPWKSAAIRWGGFGSAANTISTGSIRLPKHFIRLRAILDDSTFGVEQLTVEMRMSRMGIYRKMKAITGLSTNEMIRNYRLKRLLRFFGRESPVQKPPTAWASKARPILPSVSGIFTK